MEVDTRAMFHILKKIRKQHLRLTQTKNGGWLVIIGEAGVTIIGDTHMHNTKVAVGNIIIMAYMVTVVVTVVVTAVVMERVTFQTVANQLIQK